MIAAVGDVCAHVLEACGNRGDDERFCAELVSAVGEAWNNVAVHAYRGIATGRVEVAIDVEGPWVTVELRDFGHSFDPETVAPPDLASLPESGMGLFIMRAFVDRATYLPGRPNVLTLAKRMGRAGEAELGLAVHEPPKGGKTMLYSVNQEGQARVLRIEGELDAVSVTDIRPVVDKLATERHASVVVDLSALRLIDSSGVGAIVSLFKQVRAHGGSVVVRGVKDQPLAIFRLLRLDKILMA